MCIDDRVRHRCQHLGRIRGFESCHWYDLNEELLASGVSESDPIVTANMELCRLRSSWKYQDHDDLCVTCLGMEKERKGRARREGERSGRLAEEGGADDDETRDTIMALLHASLYDSKKKVKFSIGPSSSESSRAPSLAGSSRPPSMVEPVLFDPRLSDEGLLYPVPEARFDYPIGDLVLKDMDSFEKHFRIKAPDSNNWVFCSGEGNRCEVFAQFKNAKYPTFRAKHVGDMYPNEVVKTHLMKYLRKENQWKAAAMSLYRFACVARGHVHLLLPRGCKDPLHPYQDGADGSVESYWELFGAWVLTSMGRVKEIIRYNADDFSPAGTLWRVGQSALGKPPDFLLPPRPIKSDSIIDYDLYSSGLWT